MPGLYNFLNHVFLFEDDLVIVIETVARNQMPRRGEVEEGSIIHSATGIAPVTPCCRADSFICFSSIRADDTEACFL